jgi:hypothetical protein
MKIHIGGLVVGLGDVGLDEIAIALVIDQIVRACQRLASP